MKVKYLAILLLLTSIFTFSSCQKEEEPVNVIENGVRSVHTFIVSPDILDLMDITLTWLDFDGIIKTDTLKSCKWEKEIETGTIPNSTGVVIRAKRNDVEIRTDRTYDIAMLYNFSAVRLFSNGVGKALTTGRPIPEFRLMEMDIHKKFTERCLGRLPEVVSCFNHFDGFGYAVYHTPEISYDDYFEDFD
ncbi:MAG: hypothetical protein IKY82_05100 [Alistipes sp.]|nr:hypothetical protein [Alistipes sp.]